MVARPSPANSGIGRPSRSWASQPRHQPASTIEAAARNRLHQFPPPESVPLLCHFRATVPLSLVATAGSLKNTTQNGVRPRLQTRLCPDDPGKERIRMWLIDLDDAQLQSGLGLTVEDIAVLI
jgi:hypothetical protein